MPRKKLTAILLCLAVTAAISPLSASADPGSAPIPSTVTLPTHVPFSWHCC